MKTTSKAKTVSRVVLAVLLCGSVRVPVIAQAEKIPEWLDDTRKQIAAGEYEITRGPLPAVFQAPNRAHGFRTEFTTDGIRLTPRTKDAPSWEWSLTFVGLGRRGAVVRGEAAQLRAEGHAIYYERRTIDEWYRNEPRGLEQGFTIREKPDPTGRDVVIEMALGGTLSAFPSEDGRSIEFRTAQGAGALRYADLHVVDGLGRELPAGMEVFTEGARRGVRLLYSDEGAVYPVVVDPIVTAFSWKAEVAQSGAQFGYNLATAGDVNGDGYSDVIVGAWTYDNGQTDEGRAFVFYGSASGPTPFASWSAESNQANAYFGYSVAAAGDVNADGYDDVIVGAESYDAGSMDEGAAFLYLGSSSGLASTAAWTGESNNADARFGSFVATAGDVNGDGYADVIVGAPLDERNQVDEGRAYLFLGSAAGLAASAIWVGEGNQGSAKFGRPVATAGDVNGDGLDDVIVGLAEYDEGTALDAGRAYVFLGTAGGDGLGSSPVWIGFGSAANDFYGSSVGTAGDVNGDGYADIVVGNYLFDHEMTNEGQALVYHGSPTGPGATAAWMVEGNEAASRFGASVGTAGDVNGDGYADVIVGAYRYDNGAVLDPGRATVYLGSSTGLSTSPVWTAFGEAGADFFGHSVATAGDINGDGYSDVLAGAPAYSNGQNKGAAYAFTGSASGPSTLAVVRSAPGNGNRLGQSVATAGDVNADGYSDVVVGAPGLGGFVEGMARLYLGSNVGVAPTPVWTLSGNTGLGQSVASGGDVNADGHSDVIVTGGGQAVVFHGSVSGLPSTPDWTGNQPAFSVRSVASAGDVNGDGYSDVILGLPATRQALVYHGSASGLSASASGILTQATGNFGWSVGSAGDVNRDGYSDVIVGADTTTNGESSEGRAYVHLGSPLGVSATPVWSVESNVANALFGHSVATAGDVNGDGYSDIIVGAPGYDDANSVDRGYAFVYLGSPSGPQTNPAWAVEGEFDNGAHGTSVASAGDVNGDGYSDVIVGAPDNPPNPFYEGSAYVYLGSASGLAATHAWVRDGSLQRGFATSVASAGDVDGDGFSDVVVGDPGTDSSASRMFVFSGGGGRGLDRIPRQALTTDLSLVALLGKSDSETAMRLKALGRTPAGRGKVRLQWQVRALGSSFSGPTSTAPAFIDTGASDAEGSAIGLSVTAPGLSEGTFYHWRSRIVTSSPFFPRGPWMTLAGSNATETKFRTLGCVDRDLDGRGALADPSCGFVDADCNDQDISSWATPGETIGLTFTTKTTFTWDSPANAGGAALLYDALRSSVSSTFAVAECVETDDGPNTTATEATAPSAGQNYFYLTRAQNGCPQGVGSLGTTSAGGPRTGGPCP